MAPQPGTRAIEAPEIVQAIKVAGVVQGVGFRPFVFRLAERYGIAGWVRNVSSGVEIRAEGTPEALSAFGCAIREEAPVLAHIESLIVETMEEASRCSGFEILESRREPSAYQLISPDIATCPDCLRELFDPANRRYRYPFANCTNCGPRFTIITAIPYDRPNTTMASFHMCPECRAEYENPRDRRFHAQPIACPTCGPQVTLTTSEGTVLAHGDEAMREVAQRLLAGQIVAIKGLGGYQLACDATSEVAVRRLRQRKRRPDKAFAVMVRDISVAEELGALCEAERSLLQRPSAPVVLARCREQLEASGCRIAPNVAPGLGTLGLMLPSTPLHHILLHDVGRPLVMTSGNLSEEPIAQDNEEAYRRLAALADCYLTHNRPVHSRYDDSVWFAPAGRPQPVRRARGDAPYPVTLSSPVRPLLAMGPELKATFTLTRDQYAFVSQHIGDMENAETLEHHQTTMALYKSLFDIQPQWVACDMHPDYATTRLALAAGLPVVRVQHHHAHLASVLAENGVGGPAIGVIWDGTGLGLDGHIWGGEVLVGDARGFERAAHLQDLPLPGGDAATRHPYRIAWAYLATLLGESAADVIPMDGAERAGLRSMLTSGTRVAQTSSMGRLFDAISALLGIRRDVTYEAQAAMELEALAAGCSQGLEPYPWGIGHEASVQRWGAPLGLVPETRVIGLRPLLAAVVEELRAGIDRATIALRFHVTLADLLVSLCRTLREDTSLDRVALSGGVFQNRLLLELALPQLEAAGFEVLLHRLVPANDGGVSLGQALVANHVVERATNV